MGKLNIYKDYPPSRNTVFNFDAFLHDAVVAPLRDSDLIQDGRLAIAISERILLPSGVLELEEDYGSTSEVGSGESEVPCMSVLDFESCSCSAVPLWVRVSETVYFVMLLFY